MNPSQTLIYAAAAADGTGLQHEPAAILLKGEQIIAAATPQAIGPVINAQILRMEQTVVVPALVNAHAHLDLTHIGPLPFDGDFAQWIERVRVERACSDADIAASVREGVRLSRVGGTAAIGDIAGNLSIAPTLALREAGLAGVSFLEVFGIGRGQSAAIDRMHRQASSLPAIERGVRHGIQPHAPYSCGEQVYRKATASGRPLSTHLAETLDEIEFIRTGGGAIAEMLKRIGVSGDSITGCAMHPVEYVLDLLRGVPVLAAHMNYVKDEHLRLLANSKMSVAYCPRASAYFGHGANEPHRYLEMLQAGMNVALGTDSILCLDTPERISVFDEMRLLRARDGVDAVTLLRMATLNGARALGLREELFTLRAGETAGLLAIEVEGEPRAGSALTRALQSSGALTWTAGPFAGSDAWFA